MAIPKTKPININDPLFKSKDFSTNFSSLGSPDMTNYQSKDTSSLLSTLGIPNTKSRGLYSDMIQQPTMDAAAISAPEIAATTAPVSSSGSFNSGLSFGGPISNATFDTSYLNNSYGPTIANAAGLPSYTAPNTEWSMDNMSSGDWWTKGASNWSDIGSEQQAGLSKFSTPLDYAGKAVNFGVGLLGGYLQNRYQNKLFDLQKNQQAFTNEQTLSMNDWTKKYQQGQLDNQKAQIEKMSSGGGGSSSRYSSSDIGQMKVAQAAEWDKRAALGGAIGYDNYNTKA